MRCHKLDKYFKQLLVILYFLGRWG